MRRVLIITYYWPPAGGPGVQRWLNFVRYLEDFGVTPIVYVPENPNYPITDEALLANIPDVEILKHPISEPYKYASLFSKNDSKRISKGIIPKAEKQSVLQKLLLFVRGNFFIPDARKSWVKPSVVFLVEYLKTNRVDAIITTGPPHSLHLIGLKLKQKNSTKWIADFRDPWTSIGYHKKLKLTKWATQKHKAFEKQVLQDADHIITTSFTTKDEFLAATETPITVITNGFNKADFNLTEAITQDENFSLAHIGSLLSDRNPEILWKALSDLVAEEESFKDYFELKLAGTVSQDVLDGIAAYKLSAYVKQLGYLSHKESFKEMQKTQVLVLIEIDSEETKGIIPGKLFEYLLAGRPILAIGPEDWDASKIISETETGHVFSYSEVDAIKKQILSYFKLYKANLLNVETVDIEKYSRKNLTQALARVIEKTSA